MNMLRSTARMALLVSLLPAPGPADAANKVRFNYFNAPAYCQGALPDFEGNIRKRPLALQNEGASTAIVTCAIPTQKRVLALYMKVSSHAQLAAPVTCTAVAGSQDSISSNQYVPQAVVTSASGYTSEIVFFASSFAGGEVYFPSGWFGLSCSLSPGTGLNSFELIYDEET